MRSKDTQSFTSFATLMHETRKDFYIAVLNHFGATGNDILNILDAIETGALNCFVDQDWSC